jgi:biopolymer transport protein ExbB
MTTPDRITGAVAKRLTAVLALLALPLVPALAQDTIESMEALLQEVRSEGRQVSAENRRREQEFLSKRNQQQALLDSAKASLAAAQRRSEELKEAFDANEIELGELEETLRIRLGDMGELFGVVRQAAGEAKGMVDSSLLTAQYPDRGAIATQLGEVRKLPSIQELRDLQYLYLQEMAGSATVQRFTTDIRGAGGEQMSAEVARLGLFNAVVNDEFLLFSEETKNLQVLDPQPSGRFTSQAGDFYNAPPGQIVEMAVDPSRGALLGLVVQSPSLGERINQGGLVGYVIIGIGLIGLIIALVRLAALTIAGGKIRKQLKSEEASSGNALGRILSVYTENRSVDTDTLELKLDEAIMRETPKLEAGQGLIKVFAAVAPLLGLLGTVVGMINTFQAITLFGTGDPKLMAGGISQALVTTVLGLVVAIPLVFMHALVSGRSRSLTEVLEEQSAGLIARHAERSI